MLGKQNFSNINIAFLTEVIKFLTTTCIGNKFIVSLPNCPFINHPVLVSSVLNNIS